MQSLVHFMDKFAKKIFEIKLTDGTLYFNKIDKKYAYSQLPLYPDTQKQSNFNILGGNSTGTYNFLNGLYGPIDLSAILEKMMDTTING